ncbi:ABC transporter substrate-binding protein [Paenibacillus radicis (ex Xue et al. 2023)]|uniref:ABC transporter substrate-binding protein n=1 Tax=Paenibacillus radicis (ex Xue et al. 2023) TaxID=2972489 RepID=A0ABT1YKK7_9BACL|nr:ABC transporter substrate-binding protein [Paenibacillus radicis (ex Xue et al. 2023)]MCR8633723.1 ABC transporter substrate-binding protein [Paenibacillus radicis (ex Xue et al. 2023)]
MKKTLFILLTIMSILIVSACGEKAPQPAASPQQGTASQPSTAVQPAAPSGDKAAAGKEPRIASVSIHLTNDLLALGITPVGSVIGGDLKAFLPHVADRLKNTKPLGVVTDPDMETLLSLKPEVIYLDQQYAGKDIAKYEKIAKTEVFNLDDGTWRDQVKKIGKLVNREQQADDFVKAYQAQTERVKALVNNKIGNGTVMAVRVTAKELRVFSTRRPIGPLLYEDMGLKPAKGVDKISKDKAFEVISQEVLPDYDADAIFIVLNKEDGAQKLYQQLQASPIWQGLKAVKANHIYVVPEQPWLDYSAMGAKMAMDDAEKIFAK